jgi:hypothetical protein
MSCGAHAGGGGIETFQIMMRDALELVKGDSSISGEIDMIRFKP